MAVGAPHSQDHTSVWRRRPRGHGAPGCAVVKLRSWKRTWLVGCTVSRPLSSATKVNSLACSGH